MVVHGEKTNTTHNLQDSSKFRPIARNPTCQLKSKVNSLINAIKAVNGDLKLDLITGDNAPCYSYGNFKTHKVGNPLRPIISQTPTPTYSLAKRLNNIITPFIPTTYSLRSTDEFIDVLRSNNPVGIMASLDAHCRFTNIPVLRTTDIILDYVYHHPTLPPPKMPKTIMKEMLLACTTEAPFKCPQGKLYFQIDGVAMGSPLGVLYAQAFMSYIENEPLHSLTMKLHLYLRYVDDIFVSDAHMLEELRSNLQAISGLQFPTELNVDNKIPFLYVLVDATSDYFKTMVYRKPAH
ncbi:uncharacterized protein LOC143039082 [Oratosquilla oratoria]|uniref:uncharacterized protein LOC143039082 n=1 Tax=Oratosquilla oratoria TaxID=337810 RepID=UPI003F761BA7